MISAAAWHAKGIDFADALHLAKSASCSELVTFDARRFARRAGDWVSSRLAACCKADRPAVILAVRIGRAIQR